MLQIIVTVCPIRMRNIHKKDYIVLNKQYKEHLIKLFSTCGISHIMRRLPTFLGSFAVIRAGATA